MNTFWIDGQPTGKAQASLLSAMKLTMASQADPEQFLIAMLDDDQSALSRACLRVDSGVSLPALRNTVIASSRVRNGQPATANSWSEHLISSQLATLIKELEGQPEWSNGIDGQQDRLLTCAMIQAAKSRVKNVFDNMGVAPPEPATLQERAITSPIWYEPRAE